MRGMLKVVCGSWILVAMVGAVGCASKPPASVGPTSATIDVPPKDLVNDVKRIVSSPPVSLGVDSEHEGTIVTGYKSFRGEWHIARYWQERTRYTIQVAPDWDEPAKRSRIEVTAQTQQRAASNQTYDDAPELNRTGRAAELLKQIQAELKS